MSGYLYELLTGQPAEDLHAQGAEVEEKEQPSEEESEAS